MHKKTIVILTDNRLGHETQSIGIAKILSKDEDCEVTKVHVRQVHKIVKQLFKLFYLFVPKAWMLNFFIAPQDLQALRQYHNLAYIVSAGGDTLLPNALLKQVLGADHSNMKNLIATSLRGMPESAYDVVFTIDPHKENQAPYLFYPIAPNKMVFTDSNLDKDKNSQKLKIALLIGADTKDVSIGSAGDWFKLIKSIKTQYPLSELTLTTSRRTAIQFEGELLSLLKSHPLTMNDRYYMYNTGEQIQVINIILDSDFVFISHDSSSMVSEVIMAEKKALLVGNTDQLKNYTMQNYFRSLADRRMLNYVNFSESDFDGKLESVKVQNHSALIAEKLKNKLSAS